MAERNSCPGLIARGSRAMIEGEESDIAAQIPSLTARFDAGAIRELAESETRNACWYRATGNRKRL